MPFLWFCSAASISASLRRKKKYICKTLFRLKSPSIRIFEVSSFRNFELPSFQTIEPPGGFEASNSQVFGNLNNFNNFETFEASQFPVEPVQGLSKTKFQLNELSFHVRCPRLGPKFKCLMIVRPSKFSKKRENFYSICFLFLVLFFPLALFSPCISR